MSNDKNIETIKNELFLLLALVENADRELLRQMPDRGSAQRSEDWQKHRKLRALNYSLYQALEEFT